MHLVASTVFYWIYAATLLNPFALIFAAGLVATVFWKNAIIGMVTSFCIFFLSLCMVLALLSEFYQYKVIDFEAKMLSSLGAVWLGLNNVFSMVMFVKWAKNISHSSGDLELGTR